MEKLEAGILGTVFRNEENGWTVLTVRAGRSEVTVVGTLPELSPGEQAVFTGEWTEHKSYGRQFKCVSCEIQTPTTLLGIERYLGSGLIRGIGPATAILIVRQFGEDTLTVLSEHPERLTEIPGIGPKRRRALLEAFESVETIRKIAGGEREKDPVEVFAEVPGMDRRAAENLCRFFKEQTE